MYIKRGSANFLFRQDNALSLIPYKFIIIFTYPVAMNDRNMVRYKNLDKKLLNWYDMKLYGGR